MAEILIPFALNKHGEQVSIDEVENGLACECVCLSCNSKMVAKNQGVKNQHHFAHLKAGKAEIKCMITFENSVFWMAEELVRKSIDDIKLVTPKLLSEYDNETVVAHEGIRNLDVQTANFLPKTNELSWTFIIDVLSNERRHPLAITLSFGIGVGSKGAVEFKGKKLSNLVILLSGLYDSWEDKKSGFKESLRFELFDNPLNRRWAFHERAASIFKQLDEQNLADIAAKRKPGKYQNAMFTTKEQASLDQLLRELEQER